MRGVRAVTAVIAAEHDGEVWMAGDSASVCPSESSIECVTERKVWTVNGWILGFAGSWRAGQMVKLDVRPAPRVRDVDRYVKVDLVRLIRAACHGEPEEELSELTMLAGYGGKLYTVLPAPGMATRSQHGYAAIGASGALEALAATSTVRRPRARLLRVMHALLRHSTIVRAPVYVEHA
jgi:hypothetical protein